MKATLSPSAISNIVGITAGSVSDKPILPAESYMTINIKDGRIELEAGTMELRVKSFLNHASIVGNMDICIPAKIFYNTIRLIKSESITIEADVDKNLVTIRAGKNRYKFDCISTEDALKMDIETDMKEMRFIGDSPVKDILKASACIKEDELKPFMSTVFIGIIEGKPTIIAARNEVTNMKAIDIENIDAEFPHSMIPKSMITYMSTLKFDGETVLKSNKKLMSITCGNITISCRCAEGDYPAGFIKRVIDANKNNEEYVVVSKEKFLDSLNRIKNFVDLNDKVMAVTICGNDIELTAEDLAYNKSAVEVIDLDKTTAKSEEVQFGLNAQFTEKVFRSIESDSIKFFFSDKSANFLLPNNDKNDEIWILMPCIIDVAIKKRNEAQEAKAKKLEKQGAR